MYLLNPRPRLEQRGWLHAQTNMQSRQAPTIMSLESRMLQSGRGKEVT